MRGLRKGDPLSPSLFVLIMNTLNRALAKAIELSILRHLARRDLATTVSLYADDVVIFCHPDKTELRTIRGILVLFGHAAGLHTNFAKCSVSAIACTEEVANAAAVLMECQLAPFPIKYLCIPILARRVAGEAFQPVVDRLADKLPTWKVSMMPQAGRLALVKSVLAAIPLHQLMVLRFCKKAMKQVNKILWVGRAEANSGHCHVKWSWVCRRCGFGAWGFQISHALPSASGLGGYGGCRPTPSDLGAGSTCSSRGSSWMPLLPPPLWW
jgi:hypothetical protein